MNFNKERLERFRNGGVLLYVERYEHPDDKEILNELQRVIFPGEQTTYAACADYYSLCISSKTFIDRRENIHNSSIPIQDMLLPNDVEIFKIV
jgi:hypothetical protein